MYVKTNLSGLRLCSLWVFRAENITVCVVWCCYENTLKKNKKHPAQCVMCLGCN